MTMLLAWQQSLFGFERCHIGSSYLSWKQWRRENHLDHAPGF